jgi:hypothetical protein
MLDELIKFDYILTCVNHFILLLTKPSQPKTTLNPNNNNRLVSR